MVRIMNHLFKGKYQWFNKHFSYASYVKYRIKKPLADYKCFPCVSPGWDNSPRRKKPPYMAFVGSTPELFKKWLKDTLVRFKPFSKEENLVFINAWNEFMFGYIFISTDKYRTLTPAIMLFKGANTIDWGGLMAGSVIAVIPVTVIFLFLQKYFLAGLMSGSVKG